MFSDICSLVDCYKKAIEYLINHDQPISPITNWKTLSAWYHSFLKHNRKFKSLCIERSLQKKSLPPLLEKFPELLQAIKNYFYKHIGIITTEAMQEHINKCLQVLVSKNMIDLTRDNEDTDENLDADADADAADEKDSDEEFEEELEAHIEFKGSLKDTIEKIRKNTAEKTIGIEEIVADRKETAKVEKGTDPENTRNTVISKVLRSGIKLEGNEFIIDLTSEVEEYEKILKKKEGKDMIERCDTKYRICAKTAYNYIIALGFKYDTRKKSYYTDTHEKQENIRYRIGYCKRYIEEYEPYALRWFLVPLLNLQEIF